MILRALFLLTSIISIDLCPSSDHIGARAMRTKLLYVSENTPLGGTWEPGWIRAIVPFPSTYRYSSDHGDDPSIPASPSGQESLMLMAETAPVLVRQQYRAEKAFGSAEARLQRDVRGARERR